MVTFINEWLELIDLVNVYYDYTKVKNKNIVFNCARLKLMSEKY